MDEAMNKIKTLENKLAAILSENRVQFNLLRY